MTEKTRAAFITGAGAGLGREMALAFASDGYAVAVTGVEGVEDTAVEIRARGGHALDLPLDLQQPEQVEAAVSATLTRFHGIDVLINNAAIEGPTAPVAQVSLEDWNQTLAVNLTGTFLCDRAVVPHMMAQRSGCILHISSVAGLHAYPLRAPYAVSKWGIIGLMETLAAELGPYNIRVNAVCPGPVQGSRMARVIAHRAEAEGRSLHEIVEEYRSRTLLQRMVEPEDVVRLVLFLASDAAKNITGQAIRVCAGYGL